MRVFPYDGENCWNIRESSSLGVRQGCAYWEKILQNQNPWVVCSLQHELTAQSPAVSSQGSPGMPFLAFGCRKVKHNSCVTFNIGWIEQSGFNATSARERSICGLVFFFLKKAIHYINSWLVVVYFFSYSPLWKDVFFLGLRSTFPGQKFTFFSEKNLMPGDQNQESRWNWYFSLLTSNHLRDKWWLNFMFTCAHPIGKFKLYGIWTTAGKDRLWSLFCSCLCWVCSVWQCLAERNMKNIVTKYNIRAKEWLGN